MPVTVRRRGKSATVMLSDSPTKARKANRSAATSPGGRHRPSARPAAALQELAAKEVRWRSPGPRCRTAGTGSRSAPARSSTGNKIPAWIARVMSPRLELREVDRARLTEERDTVWIPAPASPALTKAATSAGSRRRPAPPPCHPATGAQRSGTDRRPPSPPAEVAVRGQSRVGLHVCQHDWSADKARSIRWSSARRRTSGGQRT